MPSNFKINILPMTFQIHIWMSCVSMVMHLCAKGVCACVYCVEDYCAIALALDDFRRGPIYFSYVSFYKIHHLVKLGMDIIQPLVYLIVSMPVFCQNLLKFFYGFLNIVYALPLCCRCCHSIACTICLLRKD